MYNTTYIINSKNTKQFILDNNINNYKKCNNYISGNT
jgi:hypothetical protein